MASRRWELDSSCGETQLVWYHDLVLDKWGIYQLLTRSSLKPQLLPGDNSCVFDAPWHLWDLTLLYSNVNTYTLQEEFCHALCNDAKEYLSLDTEEWEVPELLNGAWVLLFRSLDILCLSPPLCHCSSIKWTGLTCFAPVTIASTKVLVNLFLSVATSATVPLPAAFLGKFERIHNEGCMLLGSLHAPPSVPFSPTECCVFFTSCWFGPLNQRSNASPS